MNDKIGLVLSSLIAGAIVSGFVVSLAAMVSYPQPFETYFNNEKILFEDFENASKACGLVGGTIQCGPVCTCSLLNIKTTEDNLNYCKEQLTTTKNDNQELKKVGNVLWNEFLSCYWTSYCKNYKQECLTTYKFTQSQIETMEATCDSASSFEEQNKLFGN